MDWESNQAGEGERSRFLFLRSGAVQLAKMFSHIFLKGVLLMCQSAKESLTSASIPNENQTRLKRGKRSLQDRHFDLFPFVD